MQTCSNILFMTAFRKQSSFGSKLVIQRVEGLLPVVMRTCANEFAPNRVWVTSHDMVIELILI